ncbi:hypothetical protein BC938DRAFT_475704 [Jimgerdemannia flammicorona]|uniref:Uncharacterized protein n=1 Tax=Jimgerdemannia flammicorona TaxID=994334 RepID=A0A433QZ96_9FUNG|nr:hypothetical protein BC938DRAFT_475704 [Jimgerdemannia flammicorona]
MSVPDHTPVTVPGTTPAPVPGTTPTPVSDTTSTSHVYRAYGTLTTIQLGLPRLFLYFARSTAVATHSVWVPRWTRRADGIPCRIRDAVRSAARIEKEEK